MYDSPIDLYISDIQNQIVAQQDEQIYQAVVHFFPDVNRDELLKALRYDREQYDKGYADGKRDAMDELVWCKDCEHSFVLGESDLQNEPPYKFYRKDVLMCGCEEHFGDYPESVDAMFFCGYGERKEAEGDV